jgi:Spy/CpxP family protein refolding chaperone
MTRLVWLTGLVLTLALTLGSGASGQEPKPRPGRPFLPQLRESRTLAGGEIGLPGYPLLQTESVQQELGLTPEQKQKLKKIAKENADALKEAAGLDRTKLRDMKPEDWAKAPREMADRRAKRAEQTKKQIEEVLTPKQIEQLKGIEFRQRAGSLLYMPGVLQQIGLTDEQKQQVQKVREETQSKIAELQQEGQKKVLGVLTPDQTKKLKELSEKGWSGWARPAPAPQPKERPKVKRRPRDVEPDEDF